jgi:3-oxoacyl-[acyl-carrier-protein] synthase II
MTRRVVITGIGPVTGNGTGKAAFFDNVLRHQTFIREIPAVYEANYSFASRHYVPAPEIILSDYGIDPVLGETMEENAKLAVVATKLALEDAGLKPCPNGRYFKLDDLNAPTVLIGVGMSSLQTAFQSYLAHLFGNEKEFLESRTLKVRYHRLVIPMLMPNPASAWISIIFGLTGPNYTINASCASGTCAIGEAFRQIRAGESDCAIAGGVECLREKYGSIMRGFDMLTVLTRSGDGRPQPFSKRRSGFLFNEGAGCSLVLEEMGRARERGARIYAEICDYQVNSDAHSIVRMEESGARIEALLSKISKDKPVDYLNTHGTGTVANDRIEAAVIRRVFGPGGRQPYLNATKGILGHSIGASGALEAAVTALSVYHGKIHGNRIDDPLDDLNLVAQTIDTPINCAISASYGFGGHNAALLFKRFEHE